MSTFKKAEKKIDFVFLGILSALVIFGLIIFLSASFGVLAKNETKFYGILFNQIVLGLGGGIIALIVGMSIPYQFWRKYAFYIFIVSIIVTALVLVPGLGFHHGGATRWLRIGPVSFQPVELLKFGFVSYLAAWIAWVKPKTEQIKKVIVPALFLLAVVSFVLILQPDTKNLILLVFTAIVMLFVAKIPMKYIGILALIGLIGLGGLIAVKDHARSRVLTYLSVLRPDRFNQDDLGRNFQINQSTLAIGVGGVWGRGLGQSIQKFTHLPEPQGDSVFAVLAEELGFIGVLFLLILYMLFALRGLKIASHSPDTFSRLLVTGIVILIISQSFLNIASMSGLLPLTGVPLVFVSHGGTALAFALFSVGVVLQVSKHQLSL